MRTSESTGRLCKKLLWGRAAGRAGGTVVNVVSAVIFLGLIGLGVWWVIKGLGEASEDYTGAMVGARYDALSVTCQTNMRTIGQNIQMFAISNDGLPESLEELRQWSGNSRLFRCPAPEGGEYVYIPGQSRDMSGSNILVFEPNAVHDGHCSVLTVDGQLYLLTEDELRGAVAQTLSVLGVDER